MQFDVVVSSTKYDQIHEDIFMDCVYEALYDLLRISTDAVAQKNLDKNLRNNFSTSMMTNFDFFYNLVRINYLRHWEDHWESLNTGEAFPYDVEKILETMEDQKIPEMSQSALIERMKRHRVCAVRHSDMTFITVPQQEVW